MRHQLIFIFVQTWEGRRFKAASKQFLCGPLLLPKPFLSGIGSVLSRAATTPKTHCGV